jgi:predicted RNase H-like nuclease
VVTITSRPHMALIAGADGCRSGWVCVVRDLATGSIDSGLYTMAKALLSQQPTPVILAVDIPIGLSDSQPRACDGSARQVLGRPRASSVFPAPLRAVLKAATWEEAAQTRRERSSKGITKQAWGIVKKVGEMDTLLTGTPRLQEQVREVHPEVSFWAWNSGRGMRFNKKTAAGRSERRVLVDAHFGPSAFDTVRQKYPVKDVGNDDILDAFAALWTAERIFHGQARTLPDTPSWDAMGLRMEIVY